MIGIIITTFLRDTLLSKSVQSVLENCTFPYKLIIVDQNPNDIKRNLYKNDSYIELPYDSGLSKARNAGVLEAKRLGCEYCIISADSITFGASFTNLKNILPILQEVETNRKEWQGLDLLGFNLIGRPSWEARLELVKDSYFLLDFDETKMSIDTYFIESEPNKILVKNCDIVRNFFIVKTNKLLSCLWDENLVMGEHEDWFYRFKQQGFKVGFTNSFEGKYIGERTGEFKTIRNKNWTKGINLLKKKYNLKTWVQYANYKKT
jgi:glycosyltransferase involved in cell wall biosynthesis